MIFKKMKKRNLVLLISLMLVLTLAAGGTLAFLTAQTDSVVNTFTPAKSSTTIVEDFDGALKKSAQVKNTGEVTSYIRAHVIVTWKDSSGKVLSETPVAGTDYDITYPSGTGWFNVGNYYYYSSKVEPGALTGKLLTDGKAFNSKEGYNLSIEILAQSIQAEPASAVEEAWPDVTVNADDGTISKK